MKTIQNVIDEIKSLRGAKVKIFGQQTQLNSEVDETLIDVCDFLEKLKGFECDLIIEEYDEEEDEYNEKNIDDIDEYLNFLDNLYSVVEKRHDNSYNWSGNISNDIDFIIYECNNEYYVNLMVHRYGDVRGNYTDKVLLKFDSEMELEREFFENENTLKYITVEIEKKKYDVNFSIWGDMYNVYDENDKFITECYCDSIEELKEKIIESESI